MNKRDVKILLVDDEPDILEIVEYNLKNQGYQVYTASNGVEALKTAKKIIPNLILLDIMMPEMDGLEATGVIRNELKLAVPIIALTANAIKGDGQKCLDAGMQGYLSKPYSPNQLYEVISANLCK